MDRKKPYTSITNQLMVLQRKKKQQIKPKILQDLYYKLFIKIRTVFPTKDKFCPKYRTYFNCILNDFAKKKKVCI